MVEVRTEPVTAELVNDIDVSKKPGAIEYFTSTERGIAGLLFKCPCGCGLMGALDFRPHESPSWDWNGDKEKPTLTPSVHTPGHWHGFLTDGVWRSV